MFVFLHEMLLKVGSEAGVIFSNKLMGNTIPINSKFYLTGFRHNF